MGVRSETDDNFMIIVSSGIGLKNYYVCPDAADVFQVFLWN